MTRVLRGEVIAIGDELTSGQRLDTNTQWLSQRLERLGVEVIRHTTIGDDLAENVDALRSAAGRADLVVTTGGLGPTDDDLTREALAQAAGVALLEDPGSLAHIEAMFAARGRLMPAQNRQQALFPEGATPIENPGGTAPGVDFVLTAGKNACRFFCLPGVPPEMRQLWDLSVAPALGAMKPTSSVIRYYLVRCFGVGESRLEEMLPEMFSRGRLPRVGITATQGTLTLRLAATADSESACYALFEPSLQTIREKLGTLVFAEGPADAGELELHQSLLAQLAERGETLAVVEQMTGGLLASWLSESGGPFQHGTVVRNLGNLQQEAAMCRVRQGVHHAIAIGSRSEREQARQVTVAVATPARTVSKEILLAGHRSLDRPLVAKQALNLLRLELLESVGT